MNKAATPAPENPSKLTKWSNEPPLSQLKQDYADGKIEADRHITDVDNWLDNLHIRGSAKLPSSKTRSTVQPKLIRKQAEWRYSSLSEPFLSTADVFNVSPVTYEDKDAAYQNQLVLNHQINNQIDKVAFIDEYVRTGVDEGTIVIRTGWDYEDEVVTKEVPIYKQILTPTEEFIGVLTQAGQIKKSNPDQYEKLVPEDMRLSVEKSMEAGQPIRVYQEGTTTEEETVVLINQPTAEICEYNSVTFDPTCKGNVDKAKFVVYEFTTSTEELEGTGLYKNLDSIQKTGESPLATPDYNTPDNNSFNLKDEPRKKFLAYEYWGFRDINKDGKLTSFVATWVGDTLIRLDKNPYPDGKLPFIVVPLLPVRKSLYGEPDGELIKDNQDITGAVTRSMIDILASNANGQRGIHKNALDVTNKRLYKAGKDFEFNPNVDITRAFTVPQNAEIPASAQFMHQQTNADAESFSGVKAFNNGISGEALGDTATGVRGALDASSKRELGILRRLADGIVKIGKKFISMNSEFLEDEEIVRVTNEKFVAISREALAGNFDLKLSISTAEEDNQKAQELAFMLQTMGNTVEPKIANMLLADVAKLRKMPELAKKLEEYEPTPDPIAQAKAQLEVELLKAQVAEVLAESEQRRATAALNMSKAKEADADADLKNLDFLEQESGVQQERDLQKQGEQAKSNAKLEVVKSALQPKKPS
jgi:hypothetical protein